MVRTGFLTLVVALVLTTSATAQAPPRHRWQVGQVLVYKTDHTTQVTDVKEGTTVETKSHVNVTKRWQVANVDTAGVATLQMSLLALRIEQTMPKGDVLLFDSANLDKSDPDMRKQLSQFVGPTLAILRLDPTGKLIEVKESKFGAASRFENELPFQVVLPPILPQAKQTWERAYKVTLDPPLGAGEKLDAVQHYTYTSVTADALTIGMTTEIKTQPEAVADRVPLLQVQPEGEIVFDMKAGRMASATLKIDKELKGYNGEGSSYRFMSSYTEQYAGDK
jgi:hypothetical protein